MLLKHRRKDQTVAETPVFTAPAAMEGDGAYNRNSRVQAAGLSPAVPMLQRAARMAALPPEPQAVVIADHGCSQGHNSLLPIHAAIRVLRERTGPQRAISVVHTDLPDNDFTTLFQTLATSPDSYLRNDGAAFASAVGRSFYEQILPSGTVALGWSSWAVQWLSRTPAVIPDHVQIALSRDAHARAAFARQAADDWRHFLAARERELFFGGRLVVVAMALDDKGDFGYRPVLDAMYSALEEMVACGFLSAEELQRMAIPTVGRSRADLLAPFRSDGLVGGLNVEEIEMFFGEDRIWLDFEQHKDATQFGARWAAFSRASVFPTLANGLDGGRGSARASEFIDRLESSVATRLAANPQPMSIPLASLLISKRPG